MSRHTGGPAFPFERELPLNPQAGELRHADGMTLRDYFAAQALTGVFSLNGALNLDKEHIASYAYEIADAMLLEREK